MLPTHCSEKRNQARVIACKQKSNVCIKSCNRIISRFQMISNSLAIKSVISVLLLNNQRLSRSILTKVHRRIPCRIPSMMRTRLQINSQVNGNQMLLAISMKFSQNKKLLKSWNLISSKRVKFYQVASVILQCKTMSRHSKRNQIWISQTSKTWASIAATSSQINQGFPSCRGERMLGSQLRFSDCLCIESLMGFCLFQTNFFCKHRIPSFFFICFGFIWAVKNSYEQIVASSRLLWSVWVCEYVIIKKRRLCLRGWGLKVF